jgi:hypothetical protein
MDKSKMLFSELPYGAYFTLHPKEEETETEKNTVFVKQNDRHFTAMGFIGGGTFLIVIRPEQIVYPHEVKTTGSLNMTHLINFDEPEAQTENERLKARVQELEQHMRRDIQIIEETLVHAGLSSKNRGIPGIRELIIKLAVALTKSKERIQEIEQTIQQKDYEIMDLRGQVDTLQKMLEPVDRLLMEEKRAQIKIRVLDRIAAMPDPLQELTRQKDEFWQTLLNEQGKGEPPSEGWRWVSDRWTNGAYHVVHEAGDKPVWSVLPRSKPLRRTTARAAMRAASEAK